MIIEVDDAEDEKDKNETTGEWRGIMTYVSMILGTDIFNLI